MNLLFILISAVVAEWPSRLLAPYCDITMVPIFNITRASIKTGIPYWTIGPIISDKEGNPAWAGTIPIKNDYYLKTINELREQGGDIIILFGGSGVEIARLSKTVDELASKYQLVIDKYQAKQIVLDIQGSAILDNPAIELRNQALKKLQARNSDLKISFNLPTYVSGLDYTGMNVIKSANGVGLKLHSVNLLTSNYGESGAPDGKISMGAYAISALKGTYQQFQNLGFTYKLGVVPMIGQNDVVNEIFTLQNANELVGFIETTPWVNTVSYNSINRDTNVSGPLIVSSKLSQELYNFATIFKGWAGITKLTDTTPEVNLFKPSESQNSSPGYTAFYCISIVFSMMCLL
ncbi:hypothetical protein BC833DRAFT_625133 [Globomyces pollinis-pini]|nr:hypothetical protein BC833DRAFT_625133 [Globomyces pollinis-pini]